MPRILIAGCGYTGEATADLFHARGWEVEGWTASEKSARALAAKPYLVRAADILQPPPSPEFDAVVDCASTSGGGPEDYRRIYFQGAEQLIAKFPSAAFLFTSSTSVYAQRDGEWVDEKSAANPEHETARVLRETEELVLERGGIVARLAGIYGPQRSFLLEKFLAGEAVLDAAHDRFINQIHRDDIAAALLFLVEKRTETRGEIFNVADDEPFLRQQFYEWLATYLSKPLPRAGVAALRNKRGESNKRVSNRKLRAAGWAPRYPTFRNGFAESVIPSFASRAGIEAAK